MAERNSTTWLEKDQHTWRALLKAYSHLYYSERIAGNQKAAEEMAETRLLQIAQWIEDIPERKKGIVCGAIMNKAQGFWTLDAVTPIEGVHEFFTYTFSNRHGSKLEEKM